MRRRSRRPPRQGSEVRVLLIDDHALVRKGIGELTRLQRIVLGLE